MWVALFLVAEVVAIIWFAAILLAVRDRLRGDRSSPLQDPQPQGLPDDSIPLPRWKRILAIPLVVLVGPPVVFVVLVLVTPFILVQFGFLAFHSLRYKLFGIPMPRFELPRDA